ncbi:hypothetical protein SBA6_410011 [Candidatus Sulfopaludibacter sp. SbA6]|nr:hypothetical protein SBA6_410011 [Candidatus Sulfopaludibacter sp. SbA6]
MSPLGSAACSRRATRGSGFTRVNSFPSIGIRRQEVPIGRPRSLLPAGFALQTTPAARSPTTLPGGALEPAGLETLVDERFEFGTADLNGHASPFKSLFLHPTPSRTRRQRSSGGLKWISGYVSIKEARGLAGASQR